MNKEALYYQKEENTIKCKLCPHRCVIQEGKSGACRVRVAKKDENGELRLYSTNYGEITSIALDPIEKKPLNQFYPRSRILSIGTFGCNFKCPYCQNHRISQDKPETKFVSAKDMAIISKEIIDNIGLAFTYNEPIIWYEYVLDVCKNIKKINPEQKTVLVTNGYINEEPFKELLPYIDAINIDLKGGKDFCSFAKILAKIFYFLGKNLFKNLLQNLYFFTQKHSLIFYLKECFYYTILYFIVLLLVQLFALNL